MCWVNDVVSGEKTVEPVSGCMRMQLGNIKYKS